MREYFARSRCSGFEQLYYYSVLDLYKLKRVFVGLAHPRKSKPNNQE